MDNKEQGGYKSKEEQDAAESFNAQKESSTNLEDDSRFKKLRNEIALNYLRTKDADYFNTHYSGEVSPDGYLIDREGKETNFLPIQNIGVNYEQIDAEAKVEFARLYPESTMTDGENTSEEHFSDLTERDTDAEGDLLKPVAHTAEHTVEDIAIESPEDLNLGRVQDVELAQTMAEVQDPHEENLKLLRQMGIRDLQETEHDKDVAVEQKSAEYQKAMDIADDVISSALATGRGEWVKHEGDPAWVDIENALTIRLARLGPPPAKWREMFSSTGNAVNHFALTKK